MRQAVLDKKINGFIARKHREYPELSKSVNALTRELEEEDVEDVYRDNHNSYSPSRFPRMSYGM